MRSKKSTFTTVFIFFLVFNVFLSATFIYFNESQILIFEDENRDKTVFNPNLADVGDPLPYYSIIQNATVIYRLFESVNFTIDSFGYGVVDYAQMEIKFPNGTLKSYNMTSYSLNKYSYEYKPRYNAPLGFHNVSFLIYDNTNDLLNAHTTYVNFTVRTNYMVMTNSSKYYIGDDMYAELTVNNFSSYQFGWNVTIVNSTIEAEQSNIFNFEYKTVQFIYSITNETFNSFVDHTFYIKLNMTDAITGKKGAAYFPFEVLNSNPNIDTSSITFSSTTVYRTEECTISVNVTDTEEPSMDLDVNMHIEDSQGYYLTTLDMGYIRENNFSRVLSIPAERPIGRYRINITAEDQNGGFNSVSVFLTVENNLPEIHGYEINGRSANEGLTILYGKSLIFTFNVSDEEGVAFIKIALLDENNEWYNLTKEYTGIDTSITIRTVDLITGIWYVYLYVIDSDGAITSLIDDYDMAPRAVTIIPDTLSTFLPWIIFVVGIIIGILASIGLSFRYYKLKLIDSKAVSPKKKEIISKKILKKKEEEKKQSGDLLEEEKKIEEKTPEKEEEDIPKRKIKRKL
ncbi:MAG: hypothetical protein ACFFA0_12430 [Promethearchaeota archaeon]